jgi:hypothetical protein
MRDCRSPRDAPPPAAAGYLGRGGLKGAFDARLKACSSTLRGESVACE